MSNKRNILIFFVLPVLFISIAYFSYMNNYEVDYNDYFAEGFLATLAFSWLIILKGAKNKFLNIGLLLFTGALIVDSLDELKFLSYPEWSWFIFEKSFMMIAFVMVTIGFIVEHKKRLSHLESVSLMAYTDSLTDLPNRYAINESIEAALEKSRMNGTSFAVFILDFDNFKYINDIYGHEYGDRVLVFIAEKIRSIFGERGFIGRLGGDEYLTIVENVTDEHEIRQLAGKTINTFNEMHLIDKDMIHLSVSIGISIYPVDGQNRSDLLHNADSAMNKVKNIGKNGFKIFDSSMTESHTKEMDMKIELMKALDKKDLEVYYQPVISLEENKLFSMEALIRWKTNNTYVSPAELIRIAERYGLIYQIDMYVLEHVCNDLALMELPASSDSKVSINLSSRTLQNPGLVDNITTIINQSGFKPENFSFEITETAIIHNTKTSMHNLNAIRKFGCYLCLDDFGTGYSSLSHIRNLPISCVKIDKSFINGINRNIKDEHLVKAVLSLNESLGLRTISEGVETDEQLSFLKDHGCEFIQGYYFYKPMPSHELKEILKEIPFVEK